MKSNKKEKLNCFYEDEYYLAHAHKRASFTAAFYTILFIAVIIGLLSEKDLRVYSPIAIIFFLLYIRCLIKFKKNFSQRVQPAITITDKIISVNGKKYDWKDMEFISSVPGLFTFYNPFDIGTCLSGKNIHLFAKSTQQNVLIRLGNNFSSKDRNEIEKLIKKYLKSDTNNL